MHTSRLVPVVPVGTAIAAIRRSMAPASPSKCLHTDTCQGDLTGTVGNVIADIERPRRHASPWCCRRMLIWISADTIGNVINRIASTCKNVHQVIEMTKDDKQAMDAHGITSKSRDVYYYKDFKYDRLADAVQYAEIDAERRRPEGGGS